MRRVVLWFGALCLVVGVGVGAYAAYELFWTGVQTKSDQRQLQATWERELVAPAKSAPVSKGPAEIGDGIAVLYIPRLGGEWKWVVVEGVDDSSLARGPGHFRRSAEPGQEGNFAISGHRATHGQPFADLDRLRPGDKIVAETRKAWYVYRVDRSPRIVRPDRWDLVARQRSERPSITLITCHPRWGSSERLLVTGSLLQRMPRADGPPDGIWWRAGRSGTS